VTVLQARSIVARHGALEVLHGVDLGVDAGEVLAVLGANGAGKTTLARCLAGLHRDHDGVVTVDGALLRPGDVRARRRAGLVSVGERRDLVPSLPVDRYLGLVLDADGVARALELFPALGALRDRPCGLLSGGEAQMVALARALAPRPRAIVLDELSQGLAPVVLQDLLPAVRQAAADGVAVLLVEQFAHAAARVADRVLVLDQGRVTYDGPVKGAPLDEAYLGEASGGPDPTDVLTPVTLRLRPEQRRALAVTADASGQTAGEIVRGALDAELARRARRKR
jgi:branched-chain amino acid transport system ATP-binding protein